MKFSEGLGIFDNHYGYPVIDEEEKYNGPTDKVVDIEGPQAHAGRNFFVPEGREFSLGVKKIWWELWRKHVIVIQLNDQNSMDVSKLKCNLYYK